MTTSPSTTRRPIAAAAALLAVILLFGAVAFVAGMAVGGARPIATDPSQPPSDAPAETAGPTPILETVTCAEPSEAFALLCETYRQIQDRYVDEVSDEELVEGAVEGMVERLPDPYSGYLPPELYRTALDDLSGEFSGIGAEVGIRNLEDPADDESCTVITNVCALVIVAPLAGSPAEAAGLRRGDVVLAIDGEATIGSTVNELVFKVRGEAGTDVTLTVRREEEEELDITITRAVIELVEVESELLGDGVGYIKLTTFTDRAPAEFNDALGGLLADGAHSIVFDLRNNPGGFIAAAQQIASEFVPTGELLFTVESGEDAERWEAEAGGLAQEPTVEVVVLVNGGSASASEIVAAALAENGRAALVGEATFGKNTVQVWSELPNGGGLRLTTSRWFTPEHDSVADGGIEPDVSVAAPEDPTSEEDPQLDRAIELLAEG